MHKLDSADAKWKEEDESSYAIVNGVSRIETNFGADVKYNRLPKINKNGEKAINPIAALR